MKYTRILLSSLFVLLLPVIVFASIVPCSGVPTEDENGDVVAACTPDNFFDLLVNIFNIILGFLGFGAMLMIVWSGLRMIMANIGGSSQQELQEAKSTLTNAVIGFTIVAASFIIVNTLLAILGVNAGVFGGNKALENLLRI